MEIGIQIFIFFNKYGKIFNQINTTNKLAKICKKTENLYSTFVFN